MKRQGQPNPDPILGVGFGLALAGAMAYFIQEGARPKRLANPQPEPPPEIRPYVPHPPLLSAGGGIDPEGSGPDSI
jgi:hypothetical protein